MPSPTDKGKPVTADQDKDSDGKRPAQPAPAESTGSPPPPREIGGPKGREPTRYQDWERNGRCIDF